MADRGSDARRDRWTFAVAAVPFLLLAWWFWFLCDDAYITFRYARNLARGHGIRYNLGDQPSEGYSNFLWMLLSALSEAIGVPAGNTVNLVSAACGLCALWLFVRIAREHLGTSVTATGAAALALACFPPFDVWATSGLETMSFTLLILLTFERVVLARGEWGVTAGLAALGLALTRTEGVLWAGVIFGIGAIVRWRERPPAARPSDLARPFGVAALILLVPYTAYSGFRLWWFGTLVSNTTLVKAHFGVASIVRGAKYLLMFQATFVAWLPLLLGAIPAIRRSRWAGLAVALMALGFPLYGVLVGGDFMPMGRMFVAGAPFLYLLLAAALDPLARSHRRSGQVAAGAIAALVAALGVLPGVFDIHVVPQPMREALHFRTTDRAFLTEYGRWENMDENTTGFIIRGTAIRDHAAPGDTLVGQAIGAVGYISDLYIYDCYGLVTREVAELPVPEGVAWDHSPGHDKEVAAEYFVKDDPTYLHMRVVQGAKAAILMKDSFERWEVAEEVMDRYVPAYLEVEIPGEKKRSFLLMVRKALPGEDPAEMWTSFEASRVALHRELKADPLANGGEPATSAEP